MVDDEMIARERECIPEALEESPFNSEVDCADDEKRSLRTVHDSVA